MTDSPRSRVELAASSAAAGAAFVAIDAYRRCGGDPDAMTDFLMETVMASAVRDLRNAPPLEINGQRINGEDALREFVRLKAREVAAVIEGHDRPRH